MDEESWKTYRLLSPIPPGSADWVVILCDVETQEMVVRKVLVALCTSVRMRLLVVHIIVFERSKAERLMWGQRALHDGGLVRHGAF